jgi:flavin reductase (DIM6/NTAB) family NADH-FMN oxidoreductase RutF
MGLSNAPKRRDRFDRIHWHPGATGVPHLSGSLAGIRCAVRRRVNGRPRYLVGEMICAHVAEGAP